MLPLSAWSATTRDPRISEHLPPLSRYLARVAPREARRELSPNRDDATAQYTAPSPPRRVPCLEVPPSEASDAERRGCCGFTFIGAGSVLPTFVGRPSTRRLHNGLACSPARRHPYNSTDLPPTDDRFRADHN